MSDTKSQAPPRHRATTSALRTHACVRLVMAALAILLVAACDRDQLVAPPVAVAPAPESMASLSAEAASDRDVLIAFYHATDGPNWRENTNWLTDAPLGDWYGVDADASGRVVGIDLSGYWDWYGGRATVRHGLSGEIPPELGNLAHLTSLDLSVNNLSGPIPPELGNLASLRELKLSFNNLAGPIPPELGNLSKLGDFNLFRNDLSGSIPPELGNLSQLGSLDLGGNGLSGAIPPELGNLSQLGSLDLGYNGLSGAIPPELGNLSRLRILALGENGLSGAIPPELGNLSNLEFLQFFRNDLSGIVPLIFRQLTRLRHFLFDENAGLCLPDALVAWYEAIETREGPVCPDREVLRALYEAAGGGGWTNAGGWLGDGPVGEWYGIDVDSAGLVSTVDLAGNGLSGALPSRLGELAGLTALRIGDNALSGPLPRSLSQTPLRELRYANTDLCVPVETWFREWLASVPQHEGTGEACPPLTDREILTILYETTAGPNWEASSNWLTGAPLGEWYGVETNADGRVTSLDLRWNGLSGPIPPAIGGLEELRTLILFANELSGPIPPALGGLAKAELIVLAANSLSGPIPPEFGGLVALEELYLNGNKLTSIPAEIEGLAKLRVLDLTFNELTSVPAELGELDNLRRLAVAGNKLTSIPAEIGGLAKLQVLDFNFNELTSVPREVGDLAELRYLGLWANKLTSIPAELGRLENLLELDLESNELTSVPAELRRLSLLSLLWLGGNVLMSVPAELGELVGLGHLDLSGNRLTSLPVIPGGYPALEVLDLSSNEFASFPRELGALSSLRQLELDGNRLTEIPLGLAATAAERSAFHAAPAPPRRNGTSPADTSWRRGRVDGPWMTGGRKREVLEARRLRETRAGSGSSDARSGAGGFAGLEILDVSANELSGPLPAGLVELAGLTSLGLADNADLSGPLPFDLTALEHLEDLHTTGTGLCAPRDPAFLDWLEDVTRQRVALCERRDDATAYMTQAVQSREFPVPLVAGKPALLRVFVTAERETGAAMPPVRATFYRDGAVTYQLDIPSKADPIPTAIDESSLSKSVNADIPDWVIQPGLEVVIEPDPEGTLDPALGVAGRIPATGRLAVDVRAMPVFEVTLVPFVWEANPDHSILDITSAMAADSHGHELWKRTHELLPISAMDVRAHGSVLSSTNSGFEILEQTEMIRVMEGGRGHYLGVMAGPTGPGGLLGVAYGIGSWSSFSVLDAETIAHEFGHNRNLYHAPCGGAGGPDRYYPYGEGTIGAWGYDRGSGALVPPSQKDYMSYCEPTWTSDYQFANALRYRTETESNSIVVVAADAAADRIPTLLVWGGVDGEGAPYLKPAFFTDGPPARPSSTGPWSLTGRDPVGTELFSMSFAMAEFTDTDDDRSGFAFALPVTWTGELASVTLQGPGGVASLDRNTEDPLTILRDAATGRVRGILAGPPPVAATLGPAAAAGEDLDVLFSRGIPEPGTERR